MADPWGIDLGTTNTVVAVCAAREASPRSVALPGLSLEDGHWLAPVLANGKWEGSAPPVIPSVVELLDARGRGALAGAAAVHSAFPGAPPPTLARSFKRWLGRGGTHPVARAKWGPVSAAAAGEAFLRALRQGMQRSEYAPGGFRGWWQRRAGRGGGEVVIPAPVDSYESYSREVARLAGLAGFARVRSIEEPVAAALGYGVDSAKPQRVLLVDFGGGTLDLAVVRLGGAQARAGRAEVLATAGKELGGETVDRWLCELVARKRAGVDADLVHAEAGWEVEAAKKRLSLHEAGPAPIRMRGVVLAEVAREELLDTLSDRGLYDDLAGGIEEVLRAAARREGEGDAPLRPDELLLVGGSTQLPGVTECVASASGCRPREWQPFEAVAMGAALFAAGRSVDPVLYHDYALRVRAEFTEPAVYEYERIVPSGSRYPTDKDVVRHYSVLPGKRSFSLSVCEIGRFGWPALPWQRRRDAEYWQPRSEEQRQRALCLNEAAPEIPIRPPSEQDAPRLRVAFRVDADRCLRADVDDLLTKKRILDNVRLVDGLR